MKKDFKKLCECLVEKNGNLSVQDVLDCGYGVEHFIRMAQPSIDLNKLVSNAKKYLKGECV